MPPHFMAHVEYISSSKLNLKKSLTSELRCSDQEKLDEKLVFHYLLKSKPNTKTWPTPDNGSRHELVQILLGPLQDRVCKVDQFYWSYSPLGHSTIYFDSIPFDQRPPHRSGKSHQPLPHNPVKQKNKLPNWFLEHVWFINSNFTFSQLLISFVWLKVLA